ncbi:hypothetical protein D3C81_1780010 [compost metagenome]
MTNDTKVVLMPILIGDQIIHDDHPVQGLYNTGNAQCLATIQVMLIHRNMIGLRPGLHHIPGRNQFCLRCDKIFTDAIGVLLLHYQLVGNMLDSQPVHDASRHYFIIGFLLERAAPALHQTTLALNDGPFFPQPAIRRIVRRHQTDWLTG